MVNITAYYNAQDGEVYGYADNMISAAGGVPVGWYPIGVLGQAFDISWGGVIIDVDSVDDSAKVLLIKDYYIYQDGWCKVPFAYEKAPEFDIQWDGDMTSRIALDMSMLGYDQGVYFVKVSDEVFTTDDLINWNMRVQFNDYVDEYTIDEFSFDTTTYPGAFIINNSIVVLHDADTLAAALGIPTGIYPNGVYFWLYTEDGYVSRLVSPPKVIKIDEKYLPDMNVDVSSLGLHSVATSGNYNDLWNRPTTYTDVVRYNTYQSLSKTDMQMARNNIDVYSKSEVDDKVNDTMALYNITLPKRDWGNICYGNNSFIIFDQKTSDCKIAYSADGITWNVKNAHTSSGVGIYGVPCYGGDKFVLLKCNAVNSDNVYYSYNGLKWNSTPLPVQGLFNSMCYGNGMFVSIGRVYNENKNVIIYSSDGITWNKSDFPYDVRGIFNLFYGNGKFVAICSGNFYYSTDGIIWDISDSKPFTDTLNVLRCYGNNMFVVVFNNMLAYSTDGIIWDNAILPFKSKAMCHGDGKFVIIGENNIVATSVDGITWNTTIFNFDYINYLSVCYGNEKFIAVGDNGYGYCSVDGIEWKHSLILHHNTDIAQQMTAVIQPYLNLTASDVGALPADTAIPSIEGLATTSYVDTAVASLVNSAPEALNTLDELAAALGDDSNFATTVTNQIASKQDTITGTAGQFVVIGTNGKPTTKTIPNAEEAAF